MTRRFTSAPPSAIGAGMLALLCLVCATAPIVGCQTGDEQRGRAQAGRADNGASGKADQLVGTCAASDCGAQSEDGCWCDESCADYGDCCGDVNTVCGLDECTEDSGCSPDEYCLPGTFGIFCVEGEQCYIPAECHSDPVDPCDRDGADDPAAPHCSAEVGEIVWTDHVTATLRHVEVDDAGDVVVAGNRNVGGDTRTLLRKYSADGSIAWTNEDGPFPTPFGREIITDLAVAQNAIVVSRVREEQGANAGIIEVLDASGQLDYRDVAKHWLVSHVALSANELLLAGTFTSEGWGPGNPPPPHGWVTSQSRAGTTEHWTRPSQGEDLYSVGIPRSLAAQPGTGGVYLGGEARLTLLDSAGATIWSHPVSGSDAACRAVVSTEAGVIVGCGATIAAFSADGAALWSVATSTNWAALDLALAANGEGIVVTGAPAPGVASPFFLERIGPDGESTWAQEYHDDNGGSSVAVSATGVAYVAGYDNGGGVIHAIHLNP